jgi:toxin ParE1/3/4
LKLQRADIFVADFEQQARWYVQEAGEAVARRYLGALEATLRLLCEQPGIGRVRRFRHPLLKGIRSFRVNPPFNLHLIFYRHDAATLYAERVMHGARDLPRRLVERPEAV